MGLGLGLTIFMGEEERKRKSYRSIRSLIRNFYVHFNPFPFIFHTRERPSSSLSPMQPAELSDPMAPISEIKNHKPRYDDRIHP